MTNHKNKNQMYILQNNTSEHNTMVEDKMQLLKDMLLDVELLKSSILSQYANENNAIFHPSSFDEIEKKAVNAWLKFIGDTQLSSEFNFSFGLELIENQQSKQNLHQRVHHTYHPSILIKSSVSDFGQLNINRDREHSELDTSNLDEENSHRNFMNPQKFRA